MKPKSHIQLGTDFDPKAAEFAYGNKSGVIENRGKDGTSMFVDADMLRGYLDENYVAGGKNHFTNDGSIRDPNPGGFSSLIYKGIRSMPRPLRTAFNGLVNAVDKIFRTIGALVAAPYHLARSVFGSDDLEDVQLPHPKEGDLDITPTEKGYQLETIRDGKSLKATFGKDTAPGRLCDSVYERMEKIVGPEAVEENQTEEKIPELDENDPEPPGPDIDPNLENELNEENFADPADEAEYQDYINSLNNQNEKPEEEVEETESQPKNEIVPDRQFPPMVSSDDIKSSIEEGEFEVMDPDPAPKKDQSDYQASETISAEDKIIDLNENDVRVMGSDLPDSPSLRDPFALDLANQSNAFDFDESSLLEVCATEEPKLLGTSKVELQRLDGSDDPIVMLRNGDQLLPISLSYKEEQTMIALADKGEVEVEENQEAKTAGLTSQNIEALRLNGEHYSIPALIAAYEAANKNAEVTSKPILLTDKIMEQGKAEHENKSVNHEAEDPKEDGLSSIFYKHKVPGDPKNKEKKEVEEEDLIPEKSKIAGQEIDGM